jgi:hypothetical protein
MLGLYSALLVALCGVAHANKHLDSVVDADEHIAMRSLQSKRAGLVHSEGDLTFTKSTTTTPTMCI